MESKSDDGTTGKWFPMLKLGAYGLLMVLEPMINRKLPPRVFLVAAVVGVLLM